MKHVIGLCFLSVAVSFGSKLLRQQQGSSNASERTSPLISKECAEYICSEGWQPKQNHHSLEVQGRTTGDFDRGCCSMTCATYRQEQGCGAEYVANPDYDANIGDSDQVCCDKKCLNDFQCDSGYKHLGSDHPGRSKEECCAATCGLFQGCDSPDWTDAVDKADDIGETVDACCAPLCAAWTCSAGWEFNNGTKSHKGNSDKECCKKDCVLYVDECAQGFAVPQSLEHTVGTEATCCKETCGHFQCQGGWAENHSMRHEFGSSSHECCIQTCSLYSCEGDWAKSPDSSKLASKNLTNESCCEPSCKVHTCGAGYLEATSKSAKAGDTDAACCDRTCEFFPCPDDRRKKPDANINNTRAYSDEACCEPAGCSAFDGKTALGEGEGCDELEESECETRYGVQEEEINNQTVNTSIACHYDTLGGVISQCRNNGATLHGCYLEG